MSAPRPRFSTLIGAALLGALAAAPGSARAMDAEAIPFAGGMLTITETEDFEKILAFDGREITRDYLVFFDRIIELADIEVALFTVGAGGNACGGSTYMVWKPEGRPVTGEGTDDCNSPPPAATEDRLYFVPWLRPGESLPVRSWAPGEGFEVSGMLAYAPQPGTGWADFDPATVEHPLDLFRNAGFHDAAAALLGEHLAGVAAGLSTASAPEMSASGLVTARGCVPHACGSADAFVAVDPAQRRLWFAQQADGDQPDAWPPLAEWPAEVVEAMRGAIGR